MSARAVPSPRPRQPYSPRCPSPLGLPPMGFPPLAPHVAFQSPSYPITPERPVQPKGPSETRVPFPPEAHRPLAGSQRRRSQPPAPLKLDDQHHPPTRIQYPETAQPRAMHEMSERRSASSPTPSDTSSLSLYSAESVHKNFPVEVNNHSQEQGDAEEKPPSWFCGCINFRALFGGSKSKQNKILAPPAPTVSPVPQMVQTRRRPTPLNL
ncbi:hypothetical protein BDN70DRAFT_93188 [Pholiota conissans]|uniref:Uncharacterized protein n=1 Tax=Pholiota conissans TaxID=109636 RepID=A0A9P6CSU2_9AGAR|nr:hypothetical protein BDN70DRAFT_93188 [Pholiota conissans]